ncbi:MAG: outer membrane lipoprotein carrier protein LolA [Flavobacteriaceae bacterium]|nr:outer membrane lipoprotein carrier protein LolA [Flavobacteriaceae bacterium]
MKKTILIFLIYLNCNLMYSQNDSRAISLLNKVSEKIDSSVSFKISFTYTLENINEGINQKSDGSIIIKEDNYLLDFMGIKQLSDANKIYSIVPENEEIIISNIEDDDNNTIKPSKLLVFYRDGYLILWDKKEIIDDNLIQFVKLIPIDSVSDIDYLLLGVNTTTNDIKKLIEIGKNQTKTILSVKSIEYDILIEDDLFVFNKDNYPTYYIESF